MLQTIGHIIMRGGYSLARVRYPEVFVQADLDREYDVFDQEVVSRESLTTTTGAAPVDWTAQC